MFNDIKDTMEKYYSKIIIDDEFLSRVINTRIAWINKNSDYSEFLGSNYIGVYNVVYSEEDEAIFFNDLLEVDQTLLKEDINNTKGIDKSFQVTSNPFYLTCVYFMHKTYKSKLPNDKKVLLIKNFYYFFAYKVITSIFSHFFAKYKPTEPQMRMVIERMSNKFLLKRLGSWNEVLEYKAGSVLPSGLHYQRLLKINSDNIVRVVSSLQVELKDMIKNVYSLLMEVIEDNEAIKSASNSFIDESGNEKLQDITYNPEKYPIYLKSIVGIPNDFINYDLIYLIASMTNKLTEEQIKQIMILLTQFEKRDYVIDVMCRECFNYLYSKGIKSEYNRRITEVLMHLKSYFNTMLASTGEMKKVRTLVDNMVRKGMKIRVRTNTTYIMWAIGTYLIARGIYKN